MKLLIMAFSFLVSASGVFAAGQHLWQFLVHKVQAATPTPTIPPQTAVQRMASMGFSLYRS